METASSLDVVGRHEIPCLVVFDVLTLVPESGLRTVPGGGLTGARSSPKSNEGGAREGTGQHGWTSCG